MRSSLCLSAVHAGRKVIAPRSSSSRATSGVRAAWAVSEVVGAVLRSGSVPCVPYRLSKLTRYLQDTLHASGTHAHTARSCVDFQRLPRVLS